MNKEDRNNCNCDNNTGCRNSSDSYTKFAPDLKDNFKLNMEIAYKGEIGRKREKFCIDFIAGKHEIFKQMSARQNEIAASNSEAISCQKGCAYCCLLFVSASIQEGEAIVFHLYQNKDVMSKFIDNYPLWREKVRKGGDLFIRPRTPLTGLPAKITVIQQAVLSWEILPDMPSTDTLSVLDKRVMFYLRGTAVRLCRPYSHHTGRMVQYQQPPNLKNRKSHQVFDKNMSMDTSFYYGRLEKAIGSFMPIMVYNLLKSGISGVPVIPGLENLARDYLNAAEVQAASLKFKPTA
jgi:hypothetical protein